MPLTVYLSAREAAARLGVSTQTLYAYVSRGFLHAHGADDPRRRRYEREAVERLAAGHRRGRRPKEVAKATLDFGVPVLESAITLIRGGRLWYRGIDAVALSETAELEDAAALLWSMQRAACFGCAVPAATPAVAPFADLLSRFASLVDEDETASWVGDGTRLAAGCGAIVRQLVACIIDVPCSVEPIHRQCANAWGLDAAAADLVRRALVLSADHELNASGFTVRCVASTGASLRASIIAGLAALSGPRHGGITVRVEALWDGLEGKPAVEALRARLAAGEELPGFGHPLYPDGDPRAAALLSRIRDSDTQAAALVAAAYRLTGRHPSLDFGLVAVRRHLRLPSGTAFKLFALGRSLGWIAHALEQRSAGHVIRPRAIYTGPEPSSAKP